MAVVWQTGRGVEQTAPPSDQVAYIRRLGDAVRCASDARRRLADELARYQQLGDALQQWLKLHVEACEALTRAAASREIGHVRAALSLMRGAQPFALQFNRVRDQLAICLAV